MFSSEAFTLIELLIVIAVIGVMASLVMSVVGNASRDSNEVVARQQQVVLQEALNSWIARRSSTNGIATVRSNYNAMDNSARLTAVSAYLGGGTNDPDYPIYPFNISGGSIRSKALQTVNKNLTFTTWASNSFPSVQFTTD